MKKGKGLGADAQLSKNEMGEFIKKLDEIIAEKTNSQDNSSNTIRL